MVSDGGSDDDANERDIDASEGGGDEGGFASGGAGGGGGNRDNDRNNEEHGGHGDSDSDDPSPAVATAELRDILREFDRAPATVPPEFFRLSLANARAYLKATAGGVGRFLADRFPAWRAKVLADPNFPFKVLMEETVGLSLCVSGIVAARGKDVLKELDFVLIDTAVGASLNFVLMWLLAPSMTPLSPVATTASASRGGAGAAAAVAAAVANNNHAVARFVRSLPSSAFASSVAPTRYTLAQRAAAFVHKGALFSVAGFIAGFGGTSVGYGLLALRRRVAKGRADGSGGGDANEKPMPPLLAMSIGWAGFMVVSANPRYQLLTGAERVAYRFAPESVAKTSTAVLRTVNNIAGGATWVMWARAIGLNKKPPPSSSSSSQQQQPTGKASATERDDAETGDSSAARRPTATGGSEDAIGD